MDIYIQGVLGMINRKFFPCGVGHWIKVQSETENLKMVRLRRKGQMALLWSMPGGNSQVMGEKVMKGTGGFFFI